MVQVLDVAPSTLDFGSEAQGGPVASQSVYASVNVNATAFSTSLTGEAAGDYAVSTTCPLRGTDKNFCHLIVTFTPAAPGTRNATLALSADYTDDQGTKAVVIDIPLTGSGTFAAKAIEVDPETPSTLYAGVSGAGVYKSIDSGATWTAASTQPTDTRITALAIKPADSAKVFAATDGGGVFASLDGGQTWNGCADTGLGSPNVSTLAATANGQLFAGTGAGVFASTDDCASWTAQNSGLPE